MHKMVSIQRIYNAIHDLAAILVFGGHLGFLPPYWNDMLFWDFNEWYLWNNYTWVVIILKSN